MILKRIVIAATILYSGLALASDEGMVIEEDVCGNGNVIIETTDGWYISAEHHSGEYLTQTDVVLGEMKTYGFQDLIREHDNEKVNYYIENYSYTLSEARKSLCD